MVSKVPTMSFLKSTAKIIQTTIFDKVNRLILSRNNVDFSSIQTSGLMYVRNLGGCIQIGKDLKVNSSLIANPVGGVGRTVWVVSSNASLSIGNNVAISNAVIMVTKSVSIGDNVMIGACTKIYDSDFHPLDLAARINGEVEKISKAPVEICDGVFIGANVTVLKGVKIGQESVIATGSVLTKSVGEREVWGGNPARFIRAL